MNSSYFACLRIAVGITFDLNRGNCLLQCQEIPPINDFVGSQGTLPAFQILCTYSQYRILETMYNTSTKERIVC